MEDIEIKLVRSPEWNMIDHAVKSLLHGELTEGERHVGGPTLCHKDTCAENALWNVVMHLSNGNQS